MPLVRDIQSAFSGGEWSPSLYGRVDIAKYKSALRTARNGNILPQGGFRNRPGTAYIASAKDSTHSVRLIPFIASTTQAYILELGHLYMRFYTMDGQVQVSGVAAWSGATAYVPGNLVVSGGINYYCILAHTNHVPPNGTYWYALTGTIFEIPTTYAATDIFNIKFTQSADVMYLAHQSYAPMQLTFTASTNWVLTTYPFINGPFLPINTDTTQTITPSALTGSITLTAAKNLFFAGHVGALFELISTIIGQTINPSITTSVVNWIPTNSTWQAVTTGTWSGTILVQTSPDNITWTTVATVTTNTTVSGSTGFTNGFLRALMQSALAFSGTATVALTGNGNVTSPTTLVLLNSVTVGVPAGDTAKITLTALTGTGDTVLLQRSDDGGATWANTLATYTTNQAGVSVATTKTACMIRAQKTVNGGGSPVATVDGTTGAAPTLTFSISPANVSAAIQCGENWSIITTGSWTGKLRVEASTDGGNNWQLINTLQSSGNSNYNTSGSTGFQQCLLRVSSDPSVAFSGTAVVDLTSSTFVWTGIVLITAYTSATQVTGTVQNLSNTNSSGLANLSATYQWSEGAWSTYRGFPSAVTFYQDRAVWGGPQPANLWFSKTASYADFGVSSPLQDSDGINVVLAARTLNQIANLIPMPQAMLALTSDSEFGVSTGPSGDLTPTSVTQQLFGHRGSASPDPVVIGNEIVYIQQMGTTIRNFIFQLAVNGFLGDNISISSQHLFVGFSITQMAYQQEPDSIIWAIRNDGNLLSCTYNREQEMQAWTRHDTQGNFESVACMPNTTLGINEVWFVVNRTLNGVTVRTIEALKPRDQGTVPSAQWFLDCASQYNGAPANVITGLAYLNGMSVAVYADGFVLANPVNPTYTNTVKVSGGQITLPNSYKGSVVLVGLPFVSDMATLDVEVPTQEGSLQGNRIKLPRAKLRVWNSRGGYISATDPASTTGLLDLNGDKFSELTVQNTPSGGPDPAYSFDTALPLFTGILDETIPAGCDYGAHICVRQLDPLPWAVLNIMADVNAGGR